MVAKALFTLAGRRERRNPAGLLQLTVDVCLPVAQASRVALKHARRASHGVMASLAHLQRQAATRGRPEARSSRVAEARDGRNGSVTASQHYSPYDILRTCTFMP